MITSTAACLKKFKMSRQVIWTKIIIEEFVKLANLTKDEEIVLRTRAAGMTIVEQSMKLKMSVSTVNRIVARLKRKYDEVQPYSVLLPPRKSSAKELYMDKN